MSVKARKKVSGPGRQDSAVKAADLLNAEHPLNKSFTDWCIENDKEPSKRQGRKFLQEFPYYREVVLTESK
jgi:hypothetical protein